MFTNDYKNQIGNIRPDKYIRAKVLSEIENKRLKPKIRCVKSAYRVAFATVACIAMVCSVLTLNGNISSDNCINQSEEGQKVTHGYEKIFTAIEKFKTYNDCCYDEEYALSEETSTFSEANKSSAKTYDTNDFSSVSDSKTDFSETTKQVEGVDEADIVKTDGKYIYSLSPSQRKIKIINVQGEKPEQCNSINLDIISVTDDMYLTENRLVVIGFDDTINSTSADIFDISDPESPQKLKSCQQSGYYNDSRLIDTKLYLISSYNINTDSIKKETPSSFIPTVKCENYNDTVSAESISLIENISMPIYNVICGFDISDSTFCGTQSVLGGNSTVYCSKSNIITASANADNTTINRFEINDGKVTHKANANIKGFLLNQFSIDEYKENFRFVTTVYGGVEHDNGKTVSYKMQQSNSLVILDTDLKQIGSIENIAPNERVYSVRFMGDIGYFVTFRQTDPLFSVDLSDPKAPKIIGSLKIPGFSNYLFPFGDGKLLGIGMDADENSGRPEGLKLSMFNINDPSNVTENDITKIDASHSESLYNHKASLVDYNKNIIAFPANNSSQTEYLIYSYENGKFVNKAKFDFDLVFECLRGLYVGKSFYVVTDNQLIQCSLTDFKVTNTIELQ